MVFRAKRDPESSPAEGGIQAILDSRFRGKDGTSDFCKRPPWSKVFPNFADNFK